MLSTLFIKQKTMEGTQCNFVDAEPEKPCLSFKEMQVATIHVLINYFW